MTIHILVIGHTTSDQEEISNPGIRDQIAELQKLGVNIDTWTVRVNRKSSYLKIALKVFLLNFQKKRYTLVHAFYSLNGLLARLQFVNPLVVTLMGTDLLSREHFYQQGGRDALIGKIISRLADEVIVRTEGMAKALPNLKKGVHIIPSGVNTEIFTTVPLAHARRELGLSMDQKLILFPWDPARSEKGFPLVEKAVSELPPDLHARVVVAQGKTRPELALYMNACDVLVLASDYEGSPMAVREALACNLPVVSVPAGDVPSIISKIDGCYLCARDPVDMAEKIRLVLKKGGRVDARKLITPLNTAWSAAEIMKIYQSLAES